MTILILFQQLHYRDFKASYRQRVLAHVRTQLPGLVSYTRFVEFLPSVLIRLCTYLRHCMGNCTGISFMGLHRSGGLPNKRISQHKVFAHAAQSGMTSTGWFFGRKLHLLFNEYGELLESP